MIRLGYLDVLPSFMSRKISWILERKSVFLGFKRDVKGYKIWDPKDKKTILSRDITFVKSLMMKPSDSQQVESKKTTNVSQRVEGDATPHTPSSSISFEISPTVIHDENHVAK